jgi:hypothetical protein
VALNPPTTIYTWRKQFGQLEPADVKRLPGGAGEGPAEEAGSRARPRDRGHERDHAKNTGRRADSSATGAVRDHATEIPLW